MNRLVIPVWGQVLWSTGDLRLWIELPLLLKNRAGGWVPRRFRVDTATDVTTFPAFQAKQLSLSVPQSAAAGAVHAQRGLEIRFGVLRFQIVGMDPIEYVVPCFFLGDPNNPPGGNPGLWPRELLQPLALMDHLHFAFHKNATVSAPHGEMAIEKK